MEIERDVELGYLILLRQIFRLAPVTIRSSVQISEDRVGTITIDD